MLFQSLSFDPKKPYNQLPLLPPQKSVESSVVFKKTISASRALSELKGAITNLPNAHLFVDTLQLQEAQASSAIENIITTQDDLFKNSITESIIKDPAIKEVLHYKKALWFGIEELTKRPVLTTNLFIKLVQLIKENQEGIRNVPGTQLANPVTGAIIYTPPEGEEVIRQKLKNLEDFIHNEDDIDPLIKMAIIHYQFEAIHPFFDGNGRTGRILLLLYLKLSGLLDKTVLYLSKYIIENKNNYYLKLRKVTEAQDWEGWILFMLDMIEQTSRKDRERIIAVDTWMKEMGSIIASRLPKIYSKELIKVLFKLPYTKRQHLVEAGLGNSKTVGRYLNELEKEGLLKSEPVGKEKFYVNHRLLSLLKK